LTASFDVVDATLGREMALGREAALCSDALQRTGMQKPFETLFAAFLERSLALELRLVLLDEFVPFSLVVFP
jgi:hypothetical protein